MTTDTERESLIPARPGERLVTFGGYEGKVQRIHLGLRVSGAPNRGTYETLCGYYGIVDSLGGRMRTAKGESPTCKRCLAKESERG